MRDKISGILLNEIHYSEEFEQFLREKYSNQIISNKNTNDKNLISNNTKEKYEISNNYPSSKSINELSVDDFVDVIKNKKTFNLSDENIESILHEKIEFLKNSKNENFVEKEKKYLEIIEKLLASLKIIQEKKACNTLNKSIVDNQKPKNDNFDENENFNILNVEKNNDYSNKGKFDKIIC